MKINNDEEKLFSLKGIISDEKKLNLYRWESLKKYIGVAAVRLLLDLR